MNDYCLLRVADEKWFMVMHLTTDNHHSTWTIHPHTRTKKKEKKKNYVPDASYIKNLWLCYYKRIKTIVFLILSTNQGTNVSASCIWKTSYLKLIQKHARFHVGIEIPILYGVYS